MVMSPENMIEEYNQTIKDAKSVAPDLVAVFNKCNTRAGVLVAIGAILASSTDDKKALTMDLMLLTSSADAEFEARMEAAERRKHADA
jgi:hypothetical protein